MNTLPSTVSTLNGIFISDIGVSGLCVPIVSLYAYLTKDPLNEGGMPSIGIFSLYMSTF